MIRIGENEKIILQLLKKYPKINKNALQMLFSMITGRKARIDAILFSFKIKGIIDEETGDIDSDGIELEDNLPTIDKDVVENMELLSEPIKISKLAKSILYVLSKTEKSSIQFLSLVFNQKENNIYAILNRLESKNLVASYVSRIKHQSKSGRRFNPKYYVVTDFGRLWTRTHFVNKQKVQEIDALLKDTQHDVGTLVSRL